MRNGQNKRMRGRNHHHRKNQNPLTRVYESNGPDVKIRGTASHIAEKYMQLARDATSSGDPVTAENYHQHAEHYFRMIAAAQEQFRQQNPYFQPQGENRDDSVEESYEDGDDSTAVPMQGQPNIGNQQPYPPREPQPYSGHQQHPQSQPQSHQNYQQPQHHQHSSQQHRSQHQPQHNFQQNPQNYAPANQSSVANDASDIERLPSFITGGQQPQSFGPNGQNNQNGYDNQGGERYGMHRRRRRHRGHHRHDAQSGQSTGGEAPDNTRPNND